MRLPATGEGVRRKASDRGAMHGRLEVVGLDLGYRGGPIIRGVSFLLMLEWVLRRGMRTRGVSTAGMGAT